jgi:hypothetical protein
MFQTALENFNLKVLDLATLASTSQDAKDLEALTEFLITGSDAIRKAFKDDFTKALKKHRILDKIKFISFLVEKAVRDRVASFKIDSDTGVITIKFKIGPDLNHPLLDLTEVIHLLLEVDKKHELYFMILGYFTVPENYEFIQLYNALTT